MLIEQFEDKGLAQYSYAILSESERQVVLIDPARDPKPYYEFAEIHNAKIVGVILTHSHADFVSSHAEIGRSVGAKIFVSSFMEAKFPHQKIDDGEILKLGKIKLNAIYTPGHSFDSISILLAYEGKNKAIFTGDTLFIGDVGRPDLRGNSQNAAEMRVKLAKQMYHTINEKLKTLSHDVVVYPGHGAGTLCGKSLSNDSSSTIGREIKENYALGDRTEESFVTILLENQPFIPQYFSYDVDLNKSGAPDLEESLRGIKTLEKTNKSGDLLIIDTRPEKMFKKGHLDGAINIQNGAKFETWLGTMVSPTEKYILVSENKHQEDEVKRKAAKIGYELNIVGTMVKDQFQEKKSEVLSVDDLKKNPSDFTIVDIRNTDEVTDKIFENSLNIPLPVLKEKVTKIPTNKPIIVHCAGGYRSAIGSSLLESILTEAKIYDLGERIKEFK